MSEPLLRVRDLEVRFARAGGAVWAVNGVSFDLQTGETLGLVGESGCGKSATLRAIAGLLPRNAATSGTIELPGRGRDAGDDARAVAAVGVATVFQDPATHLNPVQTVGSALRETLRARQGLGRRDADAESIALLERVEIARAAERAKVYPHQLSGGLRQRVMIALALACRPALLLADEPTTALDVTTQSKVLALLERLQAETGMAMVFVSHDLAVVAQVCDSAAVMYGGCIVERGPAEELMRSARHPYSRALLAAIPTVDPDRPVHAPRGAGPPDLTSPPHGCPYMRACVRCGAECSDFTVRPEPEEEFVACLRPVEQEVLA